MTEIEKCEKCTDCLNGICLNTLQSCDGSYVIDGSICLMSSSLD